MTLSDVQTGPDWTGIVLSIVFLVIAIVLFTGRGAFLIAGYNTMPKEKKEKYDEKKLGRITGSAVLMLSLLIAFTELFKERLPASFGTIFGVAVGVIIVVHLILMNTVGKKKPEPEPSEIQKEID